MRARSLLRVVKGSDSIKGKTFNAIDQLKANLIDYVSRFFSDLEFSKDLRPKIDDSRLFELI